MRSTSPTLLRKIVAPLLIHCSQFPDNARRELLNSLHRRNLNPKFHYESIKQVAKWLKLHRACAPSQTDKNCRATYQRAFKSVVHHHLASIGTRLRLIGLGCGHGEKEVSLLRLLARKRMKLSFTPVDVSVPLVLLARENALPFLPDNGCPGLVCDLQTATDLPQILEGISAGVAGPRLYTFFGVIPNFDPRSAFAQLADLVRPQDWLLLSANLSPGADYQRGLDKVLPGYDNALTRDWLFTFLSDLGVEPADGAIRFQIEEDRSGLKRIVADFRFSKGRQIEVDDHVLSFRRGQSIRLFFSYRYTPLLIRSQLTRHGLEVTDEWITKSGEEGIFLCHRSV